MGLLAAQPHRFTMGLPKFVTLCNSITEGLANAAQPERKKILLFLCPSSLVPRPNLSLREYLLSMVSPSKIIYGDVGEYSLENVPVEYP